MSFQSGVRKRHVYGWVSIIWFTSAVSVTGSESVELQTISEVVTQCGQNLRLPCEATLDQLDIKFFAWVAGNKTCQYKDHQPDPEILCESPDETLHPTLSLILRNVMPVNQGNYICKLRSKQGVYFATTVVKVRDCLGSSDSFNDEPHAKCWFSGVYPSGIIHWFQEDVNLTNSASTQEEEDQHGRYNVSSTIDVQQGNLNKPYKCSLWIPSVGKYLSSHELPIVKKQKSSGSMVKPQWIFIMVEIMMVKFMT